MGWPVLWGTRLPSESRGYVSAFTDKLDSLDTKFTDKLDSRGGDVIGVRERPARVEGHLMAPEGFTLGTTRSRRLPSIHPRRIPAPATAKPDSRLPHRPPQGRIADSRTGTGHHHAV